MIYTVQAKSVGRRYEGIPASRLSITTDGLAEAREEFERWRDAAEVGSSTYRGSTVIRDGEVIGEFSYNGRLWCNCGDSVIHEMCAVPVALPAIRAFPFVAPPHARNVTPRLASE